MSLENEIKTLIIDSLELEDITIDDINDENYYQDFFTKVDKAIFLQKQKI